MMPESGTNFCFTFEEYMLLAYIRLLAIVRRGGRGSQMAEAFEEVFCSLDAHSRPRLCFGLGLFWTKLGEMWNRENSEGEVGRQLDVVWTNERVWHN